MQDDKKDKAHKVSLIREIDQIKYDKAHIVSHQSAIREIDKIK